MSKPVSDLSPAELTRAIAKADAESTVICDAFIAAGRGHERPSETVKLTDPLALRWREHTNRASELHRERERRREYSGTLKRIRA